MQAERDPLEPVAIGCADLHLCHKPPLARSDESDWYARQAHYLRQLGELSVKLGGLYGPPLPIFYAGDLFDTWRCPTELINFALSELPPGYAVPGQHDLPFHDYKEMYKTPYHTLVRAGRLTNLEPGKPLEVRWRDVVVRAHGFPHGFPVSPCTAPNDLVVELAVIHAYIWTESTKYQDAPEDKRLASYRKRLAGFDVALFGDNHKPFTSTPAGGGCCVFNSGGFMRRRSDEVDYTPSVGLLRRDGTFTRHYLDTEDDVFLEHVDRPGDLARAEREMGGFIESVNDLQDVPVNFQDRLVQWVNDRGYSDGVRRRLLRSIGR